jgi:AraC family transcriptional activator of pobA
VVAILANNAKTASAQWRAFAEHPIVPFDDEHECNRLSTICVELLEEYSVAREGYQIMMRGHLARIAVSVVRLASSRARTGRVTLYPADATVSKLRAPVDEHSQRSLAEFLR